MAVTKIWPFSPQVPITNPADGTPTPYFNTQLQLLLEASGLLESDITTINNSITTIEGDITDINTTIAALVLDDLVDVDTTTTPPDDGQALVWSDADSLWLPGDVASGGGGGALWYYDPPAASDFTVAFHGGTAGTYSDDPDLGYSVKNNYTGAVYTTSAMTKTVPAAGTDFSVTAHVKRNALPGNYSGMGLTLFESGTNKLGSIGLVYDGQCYIDPWHGTLTSFVGRGTRYSVAQYGKLEMFFRIRRVGTTLYFEASQDGKHYDTVRSVAQTTPFTTAPTHVGISVTCQNNPGGAQNQYAHCDYWAQDF